MLLAALASMPVVADEEPLPSAQPTAPVDENGPIADPHVPDDLRSQLPRPEPEARASTPRFSKRTYPDELVRRPLTLAEEQIKVALEVPFVLGDGHPTLTQILSGAYGLTRDLELGFTYGFGLERLNPERGEDGYAAGKAFSLDASYTLFPQLVAAQLRLAFLADSDRFGMALVLGAPFKIELGSRWAIFGGQDLVRIRLTGLPVDPTNPAETEAQLAIAARQGQTSRGSVNLNVGVLFQAQPDLALHATFGTSWLDFSGDDQPFSLFAGVTYTFLHMCDIGGRIGFYRLDEPADSFSLAAYIAARF